MSDLAAAYPEHAKLKEISHLSQACAEFLGWLSEKGLWICELREKFEDFVPTHLSCDKLLAEHFGIDPVKLEEEKLAMLEVIRRGPTPGE